MVTHNSKSDVPLNKECPGKNWLFSMFFVYWRLFAIILSGSTVRFDDFRGGELAHMHKKFEINWTKIKGSFQSGRKVVTHDTKSDLPLVDTTFPCGKCCATKYFFLIYILFL